MTNKEHFTVVHYKSLPQMAGNPGMDFNNYLSIQRGSCGGKGKSLRESQFQEQWSLKVKKKHKHFELGQEGEQQTAKLAKQVKATCNSSKIEQTRLCSFGASRVKDNYSVLSRLNLGFLAHIKFITLPRHEFSKNLYLL